jgi:[glutamine synthetase] adenylyltransferase / [glutamine synthetase]-adenylyl-L-tyrosine phosphorylase
MESELLAASFARLDSMAGLNLSESIAPLILELPDPAGASARVEAWMGALASPGAVAHHIHSLPQSARMLVRTLGLSSHIGRILVQNPEYGLVLLDPSEAAAPLTRAKLEASGRSQLKNAISYTHQLDRIRCLKQEVLVRIGALEYGGYTGPETVWLQLSECADACLTLAHEAAWNDYAQNRGIKEPVKLAVVGMGKLGGRELNTSSDVDLVFLVPDETTDDELVHAGRFAAKYIRALSDSMGRGSLYRVDMRLRPFGRSGDLVSRFRTIENYLENYAEAWEHLALIRSRMIIGSQDMADRWEAMRSRICFAKGRADWQVQEIRAMRKRIEGICPPNDIKRAAGGIRDVEFTAQLMQLVFGWQSQELRVKETLPTLTALCDQGFIPCQAKDDLTKGLLLLRQIEHHLQMEGDRQTHELPDSNHRQALLAYSCGFASYEDLLETLNATRERIRSWHDSILGEAMAEALEPIAKLRLKAVSAEAADWVDSQPDPASLWAALEENESSFARVSSIAELAPVLLPDLRSLAGITEQIISGEVAEPPLPPKSASGPVLKSGRIRAAAREVLGEGGTFFLDWSSQVDATLRLIQTETAPNLSVIALGSCAEGWMVWDSDADLVLVADCPSHEADKQARAFMARLTDIRQQGSPLQTDFRLRPEGRQGPIFVQKDFLAKYVETRMEAWERIALSRRRLIAGNPEAVHLIDQLVLTQPLAAEELAALKRIKSRVEQERAIKKSGQLDIKLGPGGMDDIVWIHHLAALAHGWQLMERSLAHISPKLVETGIVSAEEAELLSQAWKHWNSKRLKLALTGFKEPLLAIEGDTLAGCGQDANGLAQSIRLILERLWSQLISP